MKDYKHAITVYPKRFRQVVDHGKSICFQFDGVDTRLSRVMNDGQFLAQSDPTVKLVMDHKSKRFERIAIRIPKEMLVKIREALDGI